MNRAQAAIGLLPEPETLKQEKTTNVQYSPQRQKGLHLDFGIFHVHRMLHCSAVPERYDTPPHDVQGGSYTLSYCTMRDIISRCIYLEYLKK
jgi:hypothetical protein